MKRTMHRLCVALAAAGALLLGVGVPSATALESPPEVVDVAPDDIAPGDIAPGGEDGAPGVSAAAGVTVPMTSNEVAADVLGLGYEQVVRLNGARVEILQPATRGSGVITSFAAAGASSAWPRAGKKPLYYGGSNMADKIVGHSASRLAVSGRHIYVSILRTQGITTLGSIIRKYTPEGVRVNERSERPQHAVTALDAFVWKGKEYLAIGYNRDGVRVVDPDVPGMPEFRELLTGWHGRGATGSMERDQVTALKLGADGDRLLLVAGKITSDDHALVALDVIGEKVLWAKEHRGGGVAENWPEVVSIGEFGPNGRTQVAVGWPRGGLVNFIDAAAGHDRGQLRDGVLSVVRFFTDAAGEPRVGIRRGNPQGFTSLVAKPDANGAPMITETGDVNALGWMVPGYRLWAVEVENRSSSEVTFQMIAGASRPEGCWLGAGLRGVGETLPTQPVPVAVAGRAGPYATAQRLRGEACTGDNPGVLYLRVEPAGEPEQRQIVQLRADGQGFDIADQLGSSRLTAQVESDGGLRRRIVVSDRRAAPTIVGAPVVVAARLTPAPPEGHVPTTDPDDASRPVHRFTVSGVRWQVPGADTDLAGATLPLPVAEGSVDGQSWEALGTVASPLAPSRDGDRVAMGEAVFDWQNAYGATTKEYRYMRVTVGGAASNVIDVTDLPVPEPTKVATGMKLSGSSALRANGLDQTPMRISLTGGSSVVLDPAIHPDLYGRIYYRDARSKALLTGLGEEADPRGLLMFSLRPGQYANDGLGADVSGSIGVYFSTRSHQQDRSVQATFKAEPEKKPVTTASSPLSTKFDTLLAQGTGAGGVSVGSCVEGACVLKDPSVTPALHGLTPTTVGVQFRTSAATGSASLPLTHPDRPAEELRLVRDILKISGSRATLSNPNIFGAGAVFTTHVVTHGELVEAANLYVK